MGSYTYLFLNIIAIAVPLIRSFEPRINLYSKWKSIFSSIGITGLFFIIWDVIFTRMGVWGFNPKYLVGLDIINLPIEEWLFFITIPYACIFTYEVLNYFLKKDILGPYTNGLSWGLILAFLVLAILSWGKYYTVTTFLLNSLLILLHLVVFKSDYLGRFYLSYLVILIPFLIVNGVLTGTGIEEEVVWYNNQENLGIRIGTIPVEDIFYGMLLIMMNITIYEFLKKKWSIDPSV